MSVNMKRTYSEDLYWIPYKKIRCADGGEEKRLQKKRKLLILGDEDDMDSWVLLKRCRVLKPGREVNREPQRESHDLQRETDGEGGKWIGHNSEDNQQTDNLPHHHNQVDNVPDLDRETHEELNSTSNVPSHQQDRDMCSMCLGDLHEDDTVQLWIWCGHYSHKECVHMHDRTFCSTCYVRGEEEDVATMSLRLAKLTMVYPMRQRIKLVSDFEHSSKTFEDCTPQQFYKVVNQEVFYNKLPALRRVVRLSPIGGVPHYNFVGASEVDIHLYVCQSMCWQRWLVCLIRDMHIALGGDILELNRLQVFFDIITSFKG